MAKNEGLLSILQEANDSKRDTISENIELFAYFLNHRCYRKILELCPQMNGLGVTVFFDMYNVPTIKLMGCSITLYGDSHFPFTQGFVYSVANAIHKLEGTENDIGIEVVMPTVDNPRHYEFWTTVSKDSEDSKGTECPACEEATSEAVEPTKSLKTDNTFK